MMVASKNVPDQFRGRIRVVVRVRRQRLPINAPKAHGVAAIVGGPIQKAETDVGISNAKPRATNKL